MIKHCSEGINLASWYGTHFVSNCFGCWFLKNQPQSRTYGSVAFCGVKKRPQSNNEAIFKIFPNLNLRHYHITACVSGKRLTYLTVGDSLSKNSVCHWHTHLPLLWKVLFSCWVDICLTATHICHLMEWIKLNLEQSLSFNIILKNIVCVCYSWNWYQPICRLSKAHLMHQLIDGLLVARGKTGRKLGHLQQWFPVFFVRCTLTVPWLTRVPRHQHCYVQTCSF